MSENPNEGKTSFTVIAISQSASLTNAVVDSLNQAGFATFKWSPECTSPNWQSIPLLLCDNRERLKQIGIMCPYEFIVEQQDLVPTLDDKGRMVGNPLDMLSWRLETLEKLHGKTDFKTALQDWFAGAFRMALMLDATTHGNSQFVDLELAKQRADPILKALAGCGDVQGNEKTKEHADKLERLFRGTGQTLNEETKTLQSLVTVLFPEYFEPWKSEDKKKVETVGRSMVRALELDSAEDRLEALCDIYCDRERRANASVEQTAERKFEKVPVKGGKPVFIGPRGHKDRLPLAFGDRAKYVTPSGKLNLLLIDDNVDESPFKHLQKKEKDPKKKETVPEQFASSISQDDWKLLCEIFNVQTMPVEKGRGDIYDEAAKRFRKMQEAGRTFDLILVDLCLGNNRREDDLDGYAMIRIVRVFFPGTPIVVYSRFSDMEHIARAFASGAKWFLVKGEEAKLPRHVLKLLKQVGWRREWRAIESGEIHPEWRFGGGDRAFFQKFQRTREWKYLTYKSLESLPGRDITIRKMSGGFSAAVTFKATKGVWLGEEPLQTPVILKIDKANSTGMEYERYFRMIRPYIANEVGRVEMPERILDPTYSCIVYTFAGKQDTAHDLQSLGDMLDDDIGFQTACDYETYRYALRRVFDEILPQIHRVSPEREVCLIEKSELPALPCDRRSAALDAFEWSNERWAGKEQRTSFPNVYFGECLPNEFWKSYLSRMQPWGCFPINEVVDDMVNGKPVKRPFLPQATDESGPSAKRLVFHDVITDPFGENGKGGRQIIEAYTADRKLVWLSGEVSDFVARFRKRVAPETSLWFNEITGLEWNEKGEMQDPDLERPNPNDGRLVWLRNSFERLKSAEGNVPKTSQELFVDAIGKFLKVPELNAAPDTSDLTFYIKLQDALLKIAKDAAGGKAKDWEMKCPVGIVHGDLNVGNIMLESRKHPPKENDPDVTKTVADAWLIDFARTRRDLIAHDFNVFFTSVLSKLFEERLIGKEGEDGKAHIEYWNDLTAHFKDIVSEALKPRSKSERGIPDAIQGNRRFTLIYRILRRTHDAAIDAGVSQNMYLLTTALACLYTLKIFLNQGRIRLAAGCFAAAWIGYDLLCEALDLPNAMGEKQSQGRTANDTKNREGAWT